MIIQIIASIAILGLIYLIINRIIKKLKYYTRSIINLIIGLLFGLGFFLAYYFDKKSGIMMQESYYLILFATSLGFGLTIFLVFIIKEIRLHGLRSKGTLNFDKKEYLYLVLAHNNDIFLEKNNNRGVIIKLGKRDFHDEAISEVAKKYNLFVTSSDYQRIGECSVVNDKEKVVALYHAYLIKLTSDIENNNFDKVSKLEITKLKFKKIDKQIIFRSLLEEEFCIKINKREVGD